MKPDESAGSLSSASGRSGKWLRIAAAIRGKADAIITFNLPDFPQGILSRYGIQAKHPDVFISDLIELAPQRVAQSAREILCRLHNPPLSVGEYLERLRVLHLTRTAEFLQGRFEGDDSDPKPQPPRSK